mmetsp:Transcript_79291/g.224449  ORF Transcript_79291/g.224449 Transcript_79291/m.224449 type:complete len:227 (-) Transcript_79291:689-1369(-)
MHRPLRGPDVDGADPRLRRDDRPDRRAARHVVPHHEVLDRDRGALADLAEEGRRQRGRRVSLVGVRLDDDALVELRHVLALVLADVVRVHAVGAVGREQEALGIDLRPRERRDVEGAHDVLKPREHRVAVRARGGLAAHLLVVERDGDGDVLRVLHDGGAREVAEALHRGPRGQQVVDARRGDELLVDAREARGVRVHEAEVGIEDVAALAIQLLRQHLQQRGMVP